MAVMMRTAKKVQADIDKLTTKRDAQRTVLKGTEAAIKTLRDELAGIKARAKEAAALGAGGNKTG